MIRPVEHKDIPEILEIYNYYIETSTVTFEEELLDLKTFVERIESITQQYPYFVYLEDNKVVGYAYAGLFRTRIAYRFSVETSVYVHKDHYKKGIAGKLYEVLIKELKDRGIRSAIGGITLPNDASVALHEKLGFKKAGHFKEVGFKFDQWLDVGFWQLMLIDQKGE
ncbi:MAG: N-acetyltransferase family protein [Crocinitomicaceae bacterium]|nr:N-acetyltransferase [Crocinitomicaceae bacterium]